MKEYIVNLANISEYGRRMIIGNGIPKEELIRCKDCKWFSAIGYCDLLRFRIVDSYKYCAWAERKE